MISMPTNRETQPTTLVHWLHASDFHNHGICPTVCSAFIFCVPHLGAIGILIITVIIMHQSFRFCWSFAPCFALTFPFSFWLAIGGGGGGGGGSPDIATTP